MQEEEKNNGMEGMSVEEMFLGVQESYQEAQLRAQEENRAFARTEFFRMDKFGTYRLRILPIAPNPDGSPTRPGYEYPVHQLLLELEKPATGNKPQKMYVTVTRATDAGYSVDPIETYRRMAVEAAKEDGDDKLAEKIAGGSFGGGLKYSYGHCLYVFDLGERAKGVQMMTLSHAQFKDLDERKFKLWSKKLAKNPSYPCPISSVYDAYPVEIEKRKKQSHYVPVTFLTGIIKSSVSFLIPFVDVNSSLFQEYLDNAFLPVSASIEKCLVVVHISLFKNISIIVLRDCHCCSLPPRPWPFCLHCLRHLRQAA